jgi:hypothetical protein
MPEKPQTSPSNEVSKIKTEELLDLLNAMRQQSYGASCPAIFPGLDSYAPSYGSANTDSEAVGWETGTKSLCFHDH